MLRIWSSLLVLAVAASVAVTLARPDQYAMSGSYRLDDTLGLAVGIPSMAS